MKWKKALYTTMAAVLIAACIPFSGCATSSDTDTDASGESGAYRIGVVVSLTGTYAGLGTPEKNAIELEAARINESGGINGHHIEVVYEDDATDAAQAAAAAVKLVDEDGVIAVVGASGTGQTMAMRTDLERSGVPCVSMAGGSVITADFSEWVFQTPWPNRLVIPVVLKEMADTGYSNIAVISDNGAYGADGHEIIIASATEAGVTIIADETFNPGDTDMTAQLTAIRATSPDAVLLWNAGKEAAIVVNNMSQLNMDVPVYGGPGIARIEFIDGAGEAAEGVHIVAGKILVPEAYGEGTDEYGVATSFIERYTDEYGSEPDIFAGHAYDAFGLVVDALSRIEGDATPEALRDALEETTGWVGVGGTFTYTSDDHNGLSEGDLVLYEVKDGTWKLSE